MRRAGDEFGGVVKEHSGWLVPAAVFFVTACLSALVLAYYFAPGGTGLGQELPSPTDAPLRIELNVGEVKFSIPANYLPLASARRGGVKSEVDITAVLPTFSGYSVGVAKEFTANSSESSVVYLTVKTGSLPLSEPDRLKRVYLPQVDDAYGQEGPFSLRQYAFHADSGYHNQDLFYAAAEQASLLCDKSDANTYSPNCSRDYPLGNGLAVNYRFKRARLGQWREIDKGIRALIARFEDKG